MTFWQTMTGAPLTGNEEDSFGGGFVTIPDKTVAVAMIDSFKIHETEKFGTKYTIKWKIINGDFANRFVNQNLNAFDADATKRDKALNMMMRLYKLCQIKPGNSDAPTDNDLLVFHGKILSIKIGMMENKAEGKKFNFVTEIHESSYVPSAPINSPANEPFEELPF